MKRMQERMDRAFEDPERIRQFDRRVWSIKDKRVAAAAQHPDWQMLRSTAAAIKAHTVDHLDRYLTEFMQKADAAGATVHVARDAESANRIIAGVIQSRGARRVCKSKSMTTEECHLNEHLESLGVEVIDTDLGERIVQLIGEPPSHIVAPAIHRNAREIGQLFARELGSPPGESDPQRLTEVARQHLREKFLGSEVGITGVNFAVAETGSIVVIENEGNSLLTTSVPDVHIAIMGIEKVIPRWRDLPVFLNLLARSATGQRLTTYTTHYTGPQKRGPGEEGQPERQLHIVLLDNGRLRVLSDREQSRALACIRCGACMNACPVYRRVIGHAYGWVYPGPIGAVLAPAMGPDDGVELPFASSLCGACSEVCPVGIDLHRQLVLQREQAYRTGRVRRPLYRLGARFLRYPRLVRGALRFLRPFVGDLRLMATAWEAPCDGRPRRRTPELAEESFHEWWKRRRETRRRGTP